MSTQVAEAQIPVRPRPRSPEAIALGQQRKAARRARTSRLRKSVAVVAIAAFIGPFATIYQQIAEGRDPGLGVQAAAAQTATTTTQTDSAPSTTPTTTPATTVSPTPVTTQQS